MQRSADIPQTTFTIATSVHFSDELIAIVIGIIRDESKVEITVVKTEGSSILCSCAASDAMKIDHAYSYKDLEFNIQTVDNSSDDDDEEDEDDLLHPVIVFRREDGKVFDWPDPAVVLKKISRDPGVVITPKACLVGSKEWMFRCSVKALPLLNLPLRVTVNGKRLRCELDDSSLLQPPSRCHFIIMSIDGKDIPAKLTNEILIEEVKAGHEGEDVDIRVEKREHTRFICSCPHDHKAKLYEEYSYQDIKLVVKDLAQCVNEPSSPAHVPPPAVPVPPVPTLVSAPVVPTSKQLLGSAGDAFNVQGMDAFKKLVYAESRFRAICPATAAIDEAFLNSHLAEEFLSLLCHHFSHEENKFLTTSSQQQVFMSIESSQSVALNASSSEQAKDSMSKFISRSLLNRNEVSSIIQCVIDNKQGEDNHKIYHDVRKLLVTWNVYLSKISQLEGKLRDAVHSFTEEFHCIKDYPSIMKALNKLEAEADSNTGCFASFAWKHLGLLRKALYEVSFRSEDERDDIRSHFRAILKTWKTLVTASHAAYIELSSTCTAALTQIRPVDLSELIDVLRDLKIQTFEGKDVIPIIGDSGIGKSTFIYKLYDLEFELDSPEGSTNLLYAPKDKDSAVLKNLQEAGIISSAFDDSATSSIIAIEISVDGKTYWILDTPGFGDTRGHVIDLVNGYMIGKAMQSARSVRPVLLMDLEKKKLGESSKARFRNYSSLVRDPIEHNLGYFNFVITRLDAVAQHKDNKEALRADLLSGIEIIRNRIGKHDSARDFCEALSNKLSPTGNAFILDLMKDRGSDYLESFIKSDPVVNPCSETFGDCISSSSRAALQTQLEFTMRSLLHGLDTANMLIVHKRFSQLAVLKDLLVIDETAEAYSKACASVNYAIVNKIMDIESIFKNQSKLQQHQVNEMVRSLLVVCRARQSTLLSHLAVFQGKQEFFDALVPSLDGYVTMVAKSVDLPSSQDPAISQSAVSNCAKSMETLVHLRDSMSQLRGESASFHEIMGHVENAFNHAMRTIQQYIQFLADYSNDAVSSRPCDVIKCYDLLVVRKITMELIQVVNLVDPNFGKDLESSLADQPSKFSKVLQSMTAAYLDMDIASVSIENAVRMTEFYTHLTALVASVTCAEYMFYMPGYDILMALRSLRVHIIKCAQYASSKILAIEELTKESLLLRKDFEILKILSEAKLANGSNKEGSQQEAIDVEPMLQAATEHLSVLCNKILAGFESSLQAIFTCDTTDKDELEERIRICQDCAEVLSKTTFVHDLHHRAYSACKHSLSFVEKLSLKSYPVDKLATLLFKADSYSKMMSVLEASMVHVTPSPGLFGHVETVTKIRTKFDALLENDLRTADAFIQTLKGIESENRRLSGALTENVDLEDHMNKYEVSSAFLSRCNTILWTLPKSSLEEIMVHPYVPCQQAVSNVSARWEDEKKALISRLYESLRPQLPWVFDKEFVPDLVLGAASPTSQSCQRLKRTIYCMFHLDRDVYADMVRNLETLAMSFQEHLSNPSTSPENVEKILAASINLTVIDDVISSDEMKFGPIISIAQSKSTDLSKIRATNLKLGHFEYLSTLKGGNIFTEVQDQLGTLLTSLETFKGLQGSAGVSLDISLWKIICKVRNGLYYFRDQLAETDYDERFQKVIATGSAFDVDPSVNLLEKLRASFDHVTILLNNGNFAEAFRRTSALAKFISSFSEELLVPVKYSDSNFVPCLFCSSSISTEKHDDNPCCPHPRCSRTQSLRVDLYRDELRSLLHSLGLDILTPILRTFEARIADIKASIATLCLGKSELDDEDIFSFRTPASNSDNDSVSSVGVLNSPGIQYQWMVNAISDASDKALHFPMDLNMHAPDNSSYMECLRVFCKYRDVKVELNEMLSRTLDNLDALIASVYDSESRALKANATSEDIMSLILDENVVEGLRQAITILKRKGDVSSGAEDSTKIVSTAMARKALNVYGAFTKIKALIEKRRELWKNYGDHELTECLKIASEAEKTDLFNKFRDTVLASNADYSTKEGRSKLRKACEKIADQGRLWKDTRLDFIPLMKTFIVKQLDPFIATASKYYTLKKESNKGNRRIILAVDTNPWKLEPEDLATVFSGALLLESFREWFHGDHQVEEFINQLESLVNSILDYLNTRFDELDRLLQQAENYLPNETAVRVSSNIYNFQELGPTDIDRFVKSFGDITLFKGLLEKIVSLQASFTNPEIKKKIEGCKQFYLLDSRLSRLDEGLSALLDYLKSSEGRKVLDARDITVKQKYYSMLYSSQLLMNRVFNNKKSAVPVSIEANISEIDRISTDIEINKNSCLEVIKSLDKATSKESLDGLGRSIEILDTIRTVCVEYALIAQTALEAIDGNFRVKLYQFNSLIWLDDARWNDSKYANNFGEVAETMIFMKQIACYVPSYDALVNQLIGDTIARYGRERQSYEDDLNKFLSLLCNHLNITAGGEAVIQSVKALEAYKFHLRNTEFSRVPPEDILKQLKSLDNQELGRTRTDRLLGHHEKVMNDTQGVYWPLVNRCLKSRSEIKKIPEVVKQIAGRMRDANSSNAVASSIVQIIAHFFAYWTLTNLAGYDALAGSANSTTYLLQPHSAQLFAIMRILGLDSDNFHKKNTFADLATRGTDFLWKHAFGGSTTRAHKPFTLQNHLAEVKTGEGKSVVLACVACVIALLGYDVDIACYSKYLSDRDAEAFDRIFQDFGVREKIFYGTFKELGERLLDRQETLRPLVAAVIRGDAAKIAHLKQSTRPFPTDRILLIDEVDVLFSRSFFGQCYNILCSLEGKEIPPIAALFDHIWSNKSMKIAALWTSVQSSKAYQDCMSLFSQWPFLIENAAKNMVLDVNRLDEHLKQFKPKVENGDIWYFDDDNKLTNKKRFGYVTSFVYMYYHALDAACISADTVLKAKSILVNAGSISYSELPKLYLTTMGVTGTLTTLATEQKALLAREYGMPASQTTIIPSAYPASNHAVPYEGILDKDIIRGFGSDYFGVIKQQIAKNLVDPVSGKLRAVLVYFKDDKSLKDFRDSASFNDFRQDAQTLTTETLPNKVPDIVNRAVVPGQVTLVIAAFGRGTDYCYANKALDEAKGIHVIQTFLSDDFSEEVQIRGRTERQGHPGSYSMVLIEGDFEAGGVDLSKPIEPAVALTFKATREAQSAKKYAETADMVKMLKEQHKESSMLLQLLYSTVPGDLAQLKTKLQEFNAINVQMGNKSLRTVILMDGTGSMSLLFDQCKVKVKEIVNRIGTILKDKNVTEGFEIQFVVYRNYSSGKEKLLEFSPATSDPKDLFDFMDKTHVSGGQGNEAIEVGFEFINKSLAEKPGVVTQVILIGDYPPNSLSEVKSRRQGTQAGGLAGEEYWKTTDYKTAVYYEDELAKIKACDIPIYTNYVNTPAQKVFEEIAAATGGSCRLLNLQGTNDELTHVLAMRILQSIDKSRGSGTALTDLYKTTYAQAGFVL
jgi:hypothetical protein